MIDSKTAAFQIERVIWEHRGAEEEAIWIETRSDVINENEGSRDFSTL